MDIMTFGLTCMTSLGNAIYRYLNLSRDPDVPQLFHTQPISDQVRNIIDACPILKERYEPPIIWGKNGHLQTILTSKYPGRFNPGQLQGERCYLKLTDGATISFDVHQPELDEIKDDITMLICPGFTSNSESPYIFSFVYSAVAKGYRVVVLNHLGTLHEPLTSSRMFLYGGTEEIEALVYWVINSYPGTKLIGIGYSMGANILTKFLGESEANQKHFLCCSSIQQGYDVDLALRYLYMDRRSLRRLYTFAMARKYKKLIRRHYEALFKKESAKVSTSFRRIMMSTSLLEIDREYTCKVAGFSDVGEFYKKSSSAKYLENIQIPMLCLNAEDDPICPAELLTTPKAVAGRNDKVLFVTTKHGGHLGYFEGGLFIPNTVTWCDRLILQYADAIRTSVEFTKEIRSLSSSVG